MSNLHKAERVIAKHLGSSDPYSITAGQAAESLEAAGLLAQDLPEPYPYDEENTYWIEGTFQVGVSGKFGKMQVTFLDSEPGGVHYTDIESAREYALKILAACEYVSKKEKQ